MESIFSYSERHFKNLRTYGLKTKITQPAVTCSNLTIETLEQGVKYVQS